VTTAERIEARLREALAPTHVEIVDDSAKHVGHAGAAGGGHFSCLVVSDAFRGLGAVERHRAVYAALGALMGHEIHALALETATTEEWKTARRVS
jgi:BolA protein